MSYIAIAFFFLAVLGSLISQTPSLIETGSLQWLKYLWALPLGFQLLIDSKAFVTLWAWQVLVCLLLFFSYCFTCQVFTGNAYLAVNLLNICMSVVIATVSYSFWRLFGNRFVMNVFCVILVVAGFYLALSVYRDYLADASILDLGYAFKSKNSMGQILLCCGFIAMVNYKPTLTSFKIVYYFAILYMFFVMIVMKARATMVCGFFILVYYIVKSGNRKLQMFVLAFVLFLVGLILVYHDLFELIVTGILLANNDVNDINDVSSDRVFLVSEAIDLLKDNYLFGVGDFYIDCMPVAMLLQFGLLGAPFVFVLIFIIVYHVSRLDYNNNTLSRSAFLLLCAFLINALFEAQPPFGPGAKCFLLWVVIGFSLADSENISWKETTSNGFFCNNDKVIF